MLYKGNEPGKTGDPKVDTLVTCVKEFIEQVNKIADDFAVIDRIGGEAQSLIYNPEKLGNYSYKTYTGQFLGNYILKPMTTTNISKEEHERLFSNSAVHMAASFMMSKQLNIINEQLKSVTSVEETHAIINKFVTTMGTSILPYLSAIKEAPLIQTAFLELTSYQQALLDSVAQKKVGKKLGTDYGVVAHPFQHLGRVQLQLGDIAKYAKNCDDEVLKALGQKLDVINEEVKDLTKGINDSLPKVRLSG